MRPTFQAGDLVLVNRVVYKFKSPKIDDIIVLNVPKSKKIAVKRIMRIEGQSYFVQGDNKLHSTDSREFGMIEKSDIIGKVLI